MHTFLTAVTLLFAAQLQEHQPNPESIRLVPMSATDEPTHVETRIIFPRNNEQESSPVHIQLKVEGFSLGVPSDFERKKEIYDNPKGQGIRVVIDNLPPVTAYEPNLDSTDDDQDFWDSLAEMDFPYSLGSGSHLLRAFPVRSFNESLKGLGSFDAKTFYSDDSSSIDLNAPYLTYNFPIGDLPRGQPILLDFYISNCELSRDGYKVLLTIDGTIMRHLTSWVPYYLYGLPSGDHTLRLQLLGNDNKPIPGWMNDVTQTISIY